MPESIKEQRPESLEERLARVEARLQIQLALADYVLGVDGRNPTQWLAAFHADAVFEVDFPAAVLTGHDAILAWAKEVWEFQTISHITSNHRIDIVDEFNAVGDGRGVGNFKLANGLVMLATARLQDVYRKQDDVWRMSRRKVSIISSFALNGVQDLILNGRTVDVL